MSTRCNIVVSVGSSRIYFYRHHDGYLAETGADLAVKLAAVAGKPGARYSPDGVADRFVRSLFAERYEKQSYEKEARAVYELTTDLHGDIERYYEFFFASGGLMGGNEENVSITYAERPRNYPELGRWIDSSKVRFESIAEFEAAVNKDRAETNKRIDEINKKEGRERFEKYPMIDLRTKVVIS